MKLRKAIINENARMKLRETRFNKPQFKKELEKILGRTNRKDLFYVLKYCYERYSNMHADVMLEVYNDRIKNFSREPLVRA